MKPELSIAPYKKIKGTNDLNVRQDTVKILEFSVQQKLAQHCKSNTLQKNPRRKHKQNNI